MAQDWEHLGQTLGLVDHDRAGMYVEKPFKIGGEQGEIRRPFKIKASPIRKCVARKRALSALPGPHQEHCGEGSKEGVQTPGVLSGHKSNTSHCCMQGSNLQGIPIHSPVPPNMNDNPDGSLTIHIQKESPGKAKEASWLPALNGPIYVVRK